MTKRQKKDSSDRNDFLKFVFRIFPKVADVVGAVLVVTLLYLAVVRGYYFGYQIFSKDEYDNTKGITVSFTVEQGESTKEVAEQLEETGLIGDAFVFQIQTILFQNTIVAGTYELGNGMSSRTILEVLNHTQ